MKPAAISGYLVDIRNVAAHKSVRLTIEVPAEYAATMVEVFGWPTQVDPIPVGVARMSEPKPPVPDKPITPKRAMGLAQQAGAMCANAVFRAFLNAEDEEIAAEMVREMCDVESRSEIRAGTRAGDLWLDLVGRFHGWEAAEKTGAI